MAGKGVFSIYRWFSNRLSDPAGRVNMIGVGLAVGVTALLAVMVARVAQLQLRPGEKLAVHMSERTTTASEVARRGDITDRRGRVLAATRFGYRVVVDPEQFPRRGTDEAIVKLASAMGVRADEVGPRVLSRMVANEHARAQIEAMRSAETERLTDPMATSPMDGTPDGDDRGPALSRYVAIGGVLDDSRVDLVRALKIPGVHLETRHVRTANASELVGSIVGKVGAEDKWLVGSERLLNSKLKPEQGTFTYTVDVKRRPLWVEPGAYQPPTRGTDTALAIDLELQRIVEEELERGVVEADAVGGRAVLMDPMTGEIVAMVDILRDLQELRDYDWVTPLKKDDLPVPGQRWRIIPRDEAREGNAQLGRNRCIEDVYEPGSTFKAFMWAAVTELKLARPQEVMNTYGGTYKVPYGKRWVRDVYGHATQTWQEVLVNSSNIGMTIGCARMSFQQHYEAIRKFGFGSRPNTGLSGETAGIVTPLSQWTHWTQTSCSYGYQVGVTPVQIARAFCAFARHGEENGVLPPARFLATGMSDDQRKSVRVLPRWTADITRETMRGVTASLDRKLAARQVPEKGWRYELFGKSGTAQAPVGPGPKGEDGKRVPLPRGGDGYFPQYNSSFIAAGPAELPRLVMIVVIDDPGPDLIRRREHRGSSVAGPIVRRAMERALTYLGAPPSPVMSDALRKRSQD